MSIDGREIRPASAGNATSADVARLAGVSRGAVSQILNGHGARFASATRDRVLDAARVLAYEPSLAGRTLARGRSDVVVAVVPHTTFGSNLQDILEVMTDELARHGLMLVTRFSTSNVASFDAFIAAVQPVAVVTMAKLSDDHLHVLQTRRAQLVGAAESTEDHGVGQDVIGTLQAAHLIERGYRQLTYAHLKDRRQNLYGQSRYAGFRAVCEQFNLPEPRVVELGIDAEEATAVLMRFHSPGGIACYNDDVALALLFAAQRMSLKVPDDLALVGVDNTPIGGAVFPRLTTVGYDHAAIANMLTGQVLSTIGVDPPARIAPDFTIIQGGTS